MTRFTGTCATLAPVDVRHLVEWIATIPFDEWPQQHPIDGKLRPAMVTDRSWFCFGERVSPLVQALLTIYPGSLAHQWMLSVVMPGHDIPAHADEQGPNWLARIHVPLMSNPLSAFIVAGERHVLEVGKAYLVNTLARHAVTNEGATPRVHFMFDVDR